MVVVDSEGENSWQVWFRGRNERGERLVNFCKRYFISVSYTHLDVYKRQVVSSGTCMYRQIIGCNLSKQTPVDFKSRARVRSAGRNRHCPIYKGDICIRTYVTCFSELWFGHELMIIIKDGYLMKLH